MYIEVEDDDGRAYFSSYCILGLARGYDYHSSRYSVWVVDTPYSFYYSDLKKADGCYEYLKAFIHDEVSK